jgi:hypothetical protein
MYFDGFHRSFCDDEDDLESVQESDSIFAFETPEQFRPEQIRSQRSGTASHFRIRPVKVTVGLGSKRSDHIIIRLRWINLASIIFDHLRLC